MLCSRRILQQWCLAVFLLCSPVPHYGRPLDALSNRMKRSVTHAQLMHDKGRTLQDFKRRMWLQELLHEVHTAELREVQQRGGVSGGGGAISVGVPMGAGMGISLSPGTANPKPAGGTKNLPVSFNPEDEEGTNLPQETNKSQIYKDGAPKAGMKKKKKGKAGKRREGEKRKRRTRSLDRLVVIEPDNGFHMEQRIHTAQQAVVH
ncbi:parathyroid hormone-like hormone a [Neoarius graeffei]|uniref:parathyroid hormone-like hormone a n=1 Tax=Neoarius graeffei TaxID=443677 RepID=UPI00298C9F3D|nr:parathyroid hormone-like hormone a [Neoarius graeffei]